MSVRDLSSPRRTRPAETDPDTHGRYASHDGTPRLPAAVRVVPQKGGGRHRKDAMPANFIEMVFRYGDERYER